MSTKSDAIPASPLAPLISQFLYVKEPEIDFMELTRAVRRYCGNVDPGHLPGKDSQMAHYFMTDAVAEFKEGRLPTQLCLVKARPVSAQVREQIQDSLHQTWNWEAAGEVSAACRYIVVASDFMAGSLERAVRNRQFRGFLRAIQETIPADAIHCLNSQLVVNPVEFLRQQEGETGEQMMASINVRLFRIEGTNGDCLMDTMGLAVLGLPDVQCHFRQLDCGQMAGKLYDIAIYLFEKGDVISDGETVAGLEPMQWWKCQHEMAMVGPERMVLDLNPGPPFAACGRN